MSNTAINTLNKSETYLMETALAGTTQAKSLYVITKHLYNIVTAYDINDYKIENPVNVKNLDDHGGPVGLALDPDSETLFVTYEGSNIIEMVNAKTMISEQNPVTVTGASSLSGMAFDQSKQKLYVVDRKTYHLFVFLWNPFIKTLTLEGGTYKTLYNLESPYAYGIALDESKERLYVTDATNKVKYYDTATWDYKGSIDIVVNSNPRKAVGIAVDPNYLYTGAFTGQEGLHPYLVRTDITDINSPVSTEYPVGNYVIGISADEDTGLFYATTKKSGHDIEVYNTATFPSDPCYTDNNDIDQPADIIVRGDVSYKPPVFHLEKVDNINQPNSVLPDEYITYDITYGPNGIDHSNVRITDYLPHEVDFNLASGPNMVYNSNSNTVTWNIGPLDAGESNDSVTLKVKVNEGAEPNGIITNYCEIESDTAYRTVTTYTNVGFWQPDSDIIYVDLLSPCSPGTGMSWRFAYRDLQDALERARYGNQIWVAAGIYKPTIGYTRSISFEMIDDVNIYGGFPTGGGPRNPGIYQTILSGDIDNDDNPTYNSYHVVKCEDINNAILDGFTITGGNAYASSEPNYFGGGIYIYKSSPTIKDCIFSNNSAFNGGGMCNNNSDPNITNCIFRSNTAAHTFGGGMYNRADSSPTIANCIFYENQVTSNGGCGGGIGNSSDSSPVITNCTFSANYATNYGFGGGMYNYQPSPTVTNCIFWGNDAWDCNEIYPHDQTVSYCDIQRDTVYPGIGNIKVDPCFVDANSNNYHINANSPCIDKGNNLEVPLWVSTDIDGQGRIIDGDGNDSNIVDIGADEYYWNPPDFSVDGIVNFIDYAMFTTAWLSNDSEYSLDEDNDVDYDDLALFCEDWMTVAVWYQPMEFMTMGDGLGGGMGRGVFLTGFGEKFSTGYTGEVYQPEPVEEEQPEPITQQEIEDTLKWLDEVWLYPEVRESTSEDDWLEFVELVKLSLQ